MSDQIWRIQGSGNAYTPDEMACITRAAQAFLDVVSAVGAPESHHGVALDDLLVLPGSIEVTWPQPGDATARPGILAAMDRRADADRASATVVVRLAPCEVCGFRDWPEGGMRAARDIHMRDHQTTAETLARRASSPTL